VAAILQTSCVGAGVCRAAEFKLGHVAANVAVAGKAVVVDVLAQVLGDFVGIAFIKKFGGCVDQFALVEAHVLDDAKGFGQSTATHATQEKQGGFFVVFQVNSSNHVSRFD